MKTDFWLDQIPLGGVFLFTMALVLITIWIGVLLGRWRSQQPDHETEASLGTIIGAALGLLAFMLAFTFGIAAERLQSRKQLFLDFVNALNTAHLRAGLLQEPHQSQIRCLLKEYVDLHVEIMQKEWYRESEQFRVSVARLEAMQDRMWSHAVQIAQADRSSEIDALFIASLNQIVELLNSRLTVAGYRIPSIIWNILYAITILAMLAVGYQAGLSGKSPLKIGLVLAMIFAAVVFLIADLDRASEGSIRVNQQPLLEMQKKIQLSRIKTDPQIALQVISQILNAPGGTTAAF